MNGLENRDYFFVILQSFFKVLYRKLYKYEIYRFNMEKQMISVPKDEYEKLKMQANIDVNLLNQLMASFKDIKEGRIRRVK